MLVMQRPKVEALSEEDGNRQLFAVGPLEPGFGHTLGNSLRRTLLSSIPGAAVTHVRFDDALHEFDTIKGVTEDVTDIILNLKDIVVRMHTNATELELPLVANGPAEVTAGDIELLAGVEILNPDAPIATLEKKTKLEMYLTVGRGRGYSPAEDNKTEDQPIGVIPIDSIFSPIRRASYRVDSARVGQRTDFDKLLLEVETDGSIEPASALREAAELMIASLAIFTDADRVEELTQTNGASAQGVAGVGEPAPARDGDDRLIEELEIGVRAYNCLKRAGVQTIGDLQAKSESELKAIPNFGDRSIEEVIEAMHSLGLDLRDE